MKTRCVLRWNSSRSKQIHTHKFMRLWFVECVAAFRLHSTIPTEWCCVHVYVNAVLHHMLYCTVLFIVHILHRHRRHSAYTIHYKLLAAHNTHILVSVGKTSVVTHHPSPKRKTFARRTSGNKQPSLTSTSNSHWGGVAISLNGTVDELAS